MYEQGSLYYTDIIRSANVIPRAIVLLLVNGPIKAACQLRESDGKYSDNK